MFQSWDRCVDSKYGLGPTEVRRLILYIYMHNLNLTVAVCFARFELQLYVR